MCRRTPKPEPALSRRSLRGSLPSLASLSPMSPLRARRSATGTGHSVPPAPAGKQRGEEARKKRGPDDQVGDRRVQQTVLCEVRLGLQSARREGHQEGLDRGARSARQPRRTPLRPRRSRLSRTQRDRVAVHPRQAVARDLHPIRQARDHRSRRRLALQSEAVPLAAGFGATQRELATLAKVSRQRIGQLVDQVVASTLTTTSIQGQVHLVEEWPQDVMVALRELAHPRDEDDHEAREVTRRQTAVVYGAKRRTAGTMIGPCSSPPRLVRTVTPTPVQTRSTIPIRQDPGTCGYDALAGLAGGACAALAGSSLEPLLVLWVTPSWILRDS